MSALDKQIDGSHYKGAKLQPIELAYMLGATPCFTKLAKYLTRDKGDKFVNIEKARHCIELEEALETNVWQYVVNNIRALYWKIFKRIGIHPLIEEFTEDVTIRSALQAMFVKDYSAAKFVVNNYKNKCELLDI